MSDPRKEVGPKERLADELIAAVDGIEGADQQRRAFEDITDALANDGHEETSTVPTSYGLNQDY